MGWTHQYTQKAQNLIPDALPVLSPGHSQIFFLCVGWKWPGDEAITTLLSLSILVAFYTC